MRDSRSHRRRQGRRPSLSLRGALLVGAAALACTGVAAGQSTPVVNAAHSWWAAAPGRTTSLDSFFRRGDDLPTRFRPPTPRPSAGPTPTPTSTTTTTTDAAPPTTTDTPPATAGPNTNCTLVVPSGALSAAGLATPYRFTATDPTAGPCHETNPDQSAFVEAAIIDPATGAVSVYHPLVVDDGTQPAVPPVTPTLPAGAVVGVWFGFQADTLTLRHDHVRRGSMHLRFDAGDGCVNGLPNSPFTQYAYCGAPRFFAAANAAIRDGKLTVPALGTGADGQPCPTTRDFSVVDQDQSDNLPTKYLALPDGRTAQDSTDNRKSLPDATVLTNGSDNGLLDNRIDPALHCTPFTAPDLSAPGTRSAALALNELQAAAHQGTPVALVPPIDPMTEVDGKTSTIKTDLYRAGVDMPPMNPQTDTGLAYCTNIARTAPARLALDRQFTEPAPSPDPGSANLFEFLSQRLTATWTNLGCDGLTGQASPVVGGAALAGPNASTTPTTTSTSAPPTETAVVSSTTTTTPTATGSAAPAESVAADSSTTTTPTTPKDN
jgi:hypothetical protein